MSGRGVRIGIADSGVNPHHAQVAPVSGGVGIVFRDGLVGVEPDFRDLLGHGTAVAATIREEAPEADLFAIRIFRRRLRTHLAVLLRAVEWAVERRLDVLNLSLGVLEARWSLAEASVFRAASESGLLLVVPAGAGRLPAALRVRADPALGPHEYREARENGETIYFASPWPRALGALPRDRNLHGVSFAVARTSGLLASARISRPLAAARRS